MIKWIKGTILAVFSLASIMMPFSVSAESIAQSNIIGTNVWTTPISSEQFNGYAQNSAMVSVEIQLDQAYLGWINLGVTVDYKNYYYGANNPYWGDTSKTFSGNYYVNGSTVLIEIPITWNSLVSNYQMGSPTHLPDSSSDITLSLSNQGNVTPIGDLSTLQDILEVLQDIKQNVEIDIMNELIQMSEFQEILSKIRYCYFPDESLPFIARFLSEYNIDNGVYSLLSYPVIDRWIYPLFKSAYDSSYFEVYTSIVYKDKPHEIVFWCNSSGSPATIAPYFTLNNTTNVISKIERLATMSIQNPENLESNQLLAFSLYKFTISYNGNGNGAQYRFRTTINPFYIIPIFAGDPNYTSTDFALKYGLKNELLNNIYTIAQGTTASNSASSELDSSSSSFDQQSDQLIGIEDDYTDSMVENLQAIDTQTGINIFGGHFLTSAEWVRTQFNRLTFNTPYGSMVVYGLTLGLALLLLGKVFL